MISLLKFVDGRWEDVRGFIREDLEHIQEAINSRWYNVFDQNNSMTSGAIQGDPTPATRYVSNTGPDNAPKWAQVSLANGVTGRLGLNNLPQITAETLVGRRALSDGNFEEIIMGDAVEITSGSNPQLNVKVDGTSIQVNLSGELEASGSAGSYAKHFLLMGG